MSRKARTLQDLAQEIVNPHTQSVSALVNDFGKVISDLWAHARYQGLGEQWVTQHPIYRLWMVRLAKASDMDIVRSTYWTDETRRLAKTAPEPHELELRT